MKLGIGKPVRGNKFYKREKIRNQILELLEEDANVLLSAPRRVGKSSIILNIYDDCPDEYLMVYVDTEKCDSIEEYFKKLLDKITDNQTLEKYEHFSSKILDKIKNTANEIKSINVLGVGFTKQTSEKNVKSYEEKFEEFINEIELYGKKLVLAIDEFPVTVENIKKKDEENNTNFVKKFLQINRTLRLDPKYSDKISFIYTGSIGLVNVVSKLGMTEDINDLSEITIKPLSKIEAIEFLELLSETYKIKFNQSIKNYIVKKVEWLMPFYLQTIFKEIRDLFRVELPNEIDTDFIDLAFKNVIDNVNIYLDHFRSRLDKVFKQNELKFAKLLLDEIAEKSILKSTQIPELAAKFKVEGYNYIIDTLKYDGYIDNNINENEFRFNSPIFKLWWLKYGKK